ncbi:restriction endonuclease subunit S [Lactiplantibacillus plantarum]|uniref:restriction endonuclease subunit S n=1 Tax=Lactiplantibacillus plantarum TaxID=1590 RepID=UPI000B11C82B|nr:restriction endonuclease subunit S [Lactiplantibacillus plantarum]
MTRTGNTGKVVTNTKGAFHNNFFKIDYDPQKISKLFLYFLLTSIPIQKEILIRAGTSTIPDLNHKDFYNIKVYLPIFEEQQRIGSFFKQLDDTIALHQRKLDLLKEQKKGYLQKMFPKNGAKVPELRFAGFADDWEERNLGDVGDTFTGLTGKTKEDFGHGSAKFVTYVNVFQNPIATLDQIDAVEIDEKQNQVQKGDVFFTTSSETPEEVGMSSVWTYDTKNVYLNSFTFGYRPRVSFDLNYMASMLRSPSIRKKITFLAQGISRYNISKTKMLEIEIPAPNLSEQKKIGSFFKLLDDTIALHQRQLDLLKEQKKGFLQKMFV